MSLEKEDLRAAVASGLITEAQAASLTKLADERLGYRDARTEVDEPFELFKGFNEIFIVIGLLILYIGWSLFTGMSALFSGSFASGGSLITYGLLQLAGVAALSGYFTLKRRMIAPSILLSILFALGAQQVGRGLHSILNLPDGQLLALSAAITAALLIVYWVVFRIPFALLLTGLAIFATSLGISSLGGMEVDGLTDLFLLSGSGSFSVITLGLGFIAFAVALRFDMSDPHRVTRRSANGFWLHVLAAPAIVNSVALTLYASSSMLANTLLGLFLLFIALVAIVIDRRSFLISGIGYMIALAITVLDGSFGLLVLLVGSGLVLLGSNWEKLRGALMRALPEFKGKGLLPPWALRVKEDT